MKVHYSLMGESAVSPELCAAALWGIRTACMELRLAQPVQLFWIEELGEEDKAYLEQYPQDLDLFETVELDEGLLGLAVGPDKIFLTAREWNPIELIEIAAHETAHLAQRPELRANNEAAEREARAFSKLFVLAFFRQFYQERKGIYL